MREIKAIVIHCSATPNGRWTIAPDIDRWHDDRGFERQPYWRERFNPDYKAIGYHFVIYTNGATAIEYGLIAALISVTIIAVLGSVGNKLNANYTKINNKL